MAKKPAEKSRLKATDYVPVVFLHGMGDSGRNSGMKSICKSASDKFPGMHSVCSNVVRLRTAAISPLAGHMSIC